MKKETDFDNDIKINQFQLDKECVTHSALYLKYGELLAEAKNETGILADALKLKMSEANISIRNKFVSKEIKFTEAVISSEVEKNEAVVTAREELREAELSLARLQAGVSAFEHRKSQLDNLVKLYCAGYFSVPSSGRAGDGINDRAGMEARDRLKNGKSRPSVDDEEDDE